MTEDDYYLKHNVCPKCGNTILLTTLVGYIFTGDDFKDKNKIECWKCGWTGITHDLIEGEKK
jgi:ribosomal protein S27AE